MYNCFYHLGRVVLQVTCINLLVTEYFGVKLCIIWKKSWPGFASPFIYVIYTFSPYMHLYSNVLGAMVNLSKKMWILIKFELSIFVICSGPVDKVFQSKNRSTEGIAEYISRVQIQPVPINKFSRVTGFLYWYTLSCMAIRFLWDTFTYFNYFSIRDSLRYSVFSFQIKRQSNFSFSVINTNISQKSSQVPHSKCTIFF